MNSITDNWFFNTICIGRQPTRHYQTVKIHHLRFISYEDGCSIQLCFAITITNLSKTSHFKFLEKLLLIFLNSCKQVGFEWMVTRITNISKFILYFVVVHYTLLTCFHNTICSNLHAKNWNFIGIYNLPYYFHNIFQ